MRRSSAVLVVSICGALTTSAPALAEGRAGDVIPGKYIVVAEEGRDPSAVARWQQARDRQALPLVNGFAASLDAAQLQALRQSARVAYVEPDRVVTADAVQNMDANGDPWGLDRIDQRNRPLSRTYTYNGNGSGVTAFVIDTGINYSHRDFGGRASLAYDVFGGTGADCHGHGTHVAGTIGGATYGVAKAVTLKSVRVLNCSGSGSTSGIIAALNHVANTHPPRSVANMSLGGGRSTALNSATNNLATQGVFIAVAAGNENQNACNVSPASAANAYTTAASDKTDRKAWFSNWGSCVDGWAPGVAIKSAWLGAATTNTISGTSMASPHVAGVAALHKGATGDPSWQTVTSWINANATANVIAGNPSGTPNRLLYKAGL